MSSLLRQLQAGEEIQPIRSFSMPFNPDTVISLISVVYRLFFRCRNISPVKFVQLKSKLLNVVQFTDLKSCSTPEFLRFGQALRLSFFSVLRNFELASASRVQFVKRVERRSKSLSVEHFFELKNLYSPLSLILMHFVILRDCKKVRKGDQEIANII